MIRTTLAATSLFDFAIFPSGSRPHRSPDLAQRDNSITWPAKYNPDVTPVFSHNELVIPVSCHRVWQTFTDVEKWPSWFVLVKDVHVQDRGPLQKNSLVTFRIFDTPVSAKLDTYIPESQISWYPTAVGDTDPIHYHAWSFHPVGSGCRVVTEESGIGNADSADPAHSDTFMHRAHELWLASLKYQSEQ